MGKFATETKVPVEKTRAEIEATLSRYGATEFGYMRREREAVIAFATANRKVRFNLPLPALDDKEFRQTPGKRSTRSPEGIRAAWDQACRQRWRALLLAIKAKLEAVDSKISTFEQEFMAFVVDPVTLKTVGETITPLIEERYQRPEGSAPLGLPDYTGGNS